MDTYIESLLLRARVHMDTDGLIPLDLHAELLAAGVNPEPLTESDYE